MSQGTYDYVNDGATYDWQPPQPEVQQEADKHIKAVVAPSFPIMDDVAQWFDEQIADSRDRRNIQVTALTVNGVKYSREVSVEAQVLAMELLEQKLTAKRAEWGTFGESDD